MPFVLQIIILRRYTVLYIIWRDVESNKEMYPEMVSLANLNVVKDNFILYLYYQ